MVNDSASVPGSASHWTASIDGLTPGDLLFVGCLEAIDRPGEILIYRLIPGDTAPADEYTLRRCNDVLYELRVSETMWQRLATCECGARDDNLARDHIAGYASHLAQDLFGGDEPHLLQSA